MIVTNALVLSRSPYRDADRMVTLFSPELGRISACARGCLKAKSPLMNATEPFTAGEFAFVESRGRLSMTQCAITESFYPLREDLDRFVAGSYFLHLIGLAATPDEGARELFDLSLKALAHLSYAPLPVPLVVAAFEMHYLRLMGQSPRTDSCVLCGKPIDSSARFDVARGGCLCENCPGGAPISNGARRILLRAPQKRFEAVELLVEHPAWPEAARLIREFLRYRVEKEPKIWPATAD